MENNEVKINSLIEKMASLPENNFTKTILIPLYMAMGYRTDFYGGNSEGGKDLICWKDDDFGEKELTVIQVKKVKASAAASSSKSFGEIVTQLSQAIEKEIPALDGARRRPDKVIFITPYQIDTRALESRFEGYAAIRNRGARVYDGKQVAIQLISRKLDKVISGLLGEEYELRDNPIAGYSNRDLLSALNYGKERSVRHFYTDLDFGIGKIRTGTFLDTDFSPRKYEAIIDYVHWNSFQRTVNQIESYLGEQITNPPLMLVNKKYHQAQALWSSASNVQLIGTVNSLIEKLIELIEGLGFSATKILPEITSRKKSKLTPFELYITTENDDQSETIDALLVDRAECALKAIKNSCNEIIDNVFEGDKKNIDKYKADQLADAARDIDTNWKPVVEFIDAIGDKTQDLLKESTSQTIKKIIPIANEIQQSVYRFPPKPILQVEVNGILLAEKLQEEQKNIRLALGEIQQHNVNSRQIKLCFEKCLQVLRVVDSIYTNHILFNSISPCERANSSSRIHLQIDKIFDAGMDVVLYGEAGGGKSTTLDMYAVKIVESGHKDWLPLYLPLTKITRLVDREVADGKDRLELIEEGIVRYLNANGLIITRENFKKMISMKGRSVFLFDGVDEVAKSSPWIVEGISKLKEVYANSQLIITSRVSGNYLDNIDCLKLTLLPFSDSQLKKFVSAWFSEDAEKTQQINSHLISHPEISTVVKTPLLATILCVLAENNVPLPTSELSLYKERLKLLLGHYDIHKGIKRQESHHEILEIVARKIAFGLQSRNARMAPIEDLKSTATNALLNKFHISQIEKAVDELCDPCNILLPMSSQGDWGFGHLRYQEHLAAEELVRNRGIEIEPFLMSDWWRSVLVFFSQMTDDFENVLNTHILTKGQVGSAFDTLKAMILVRHPKERKEFMRILMAHKQIDAFDGDDDYEFSYD